MLAWDQGMGSADWRSGLDWGGDLDQFAVGVLRSTKGRFGRRKEFSSWKDALYSDFPFEERKDNSRLTGTSHKSHSRSTVQP